MNQVSGKVAIAGLRVKDTRQSTYIQGVETCTWCRDATASLNRGRLIKFWPNILDTLSCASVYRVETTPFIRDWTCYPLHATFKNYVRHIVERVVIYINRYTENCENFYRLTHTITNVVSFETFCS